MQSEHLQFVEENIQIILDNSKPLQSITVIDNQGRLDQLNKELDLNKIQKVIDEIKYEDIQQNLQESLTEYEQMINEQISTETIQEPINFKDINGMYHLDKTKQTKDLNQNFTKSKEIMISMNDETETDDSKVNSEMNNNKCKTHINNDNNNQITFEINTESEIFSEIIKIDNQQVYNSNQYSNNCSNIRIIEQFNEKQSNLINQQLNHALLDINSSLIDKCENKIDFKNLQNDIINKYSSQIKSNLQEKISELQNDQQIASLTFSQDNPYNFDQLKQISYLNQNNEGDFYQKSSSKQSRVIEIQADDQNKQLQQQLNCQNLQNKQTYENNFLKKRIKLENGQYKNIYQQNYNNDINNYNNNNQNSSQNKSHQIIQELYKQKNQYLQQLSQITYQQQSSNNLHNNLNNSNNINTCSLQEIFSQIKQNQNDINEQSSNITNIKFQNQNQNIEDRQNLTNDSKVFIKNEITSQNSMLNHQNKKYSQIKTNLRNKQHQSNIIQKPFLRKVVCTDNNNIDTNKSKRKQILGIDIHDINNQVGEDFGCEFVQYVICSNSIQKKGLEDINVQFVRRSMRNSKKSQEQVLNVQSCKEKEQQSNLITFLYQKQLNFYLKQGNKGNSLESKIQNKQQPSSRASKRKYNISK